MGKNKIYIIVFVLLLVLIVLLGIMNTLGSRVRKSEQAQEGYVTPTRVEILPSGAPPVAFTSSITITPGLSPTLLPTQKVETINKIFTLNYPLKVEDHIIDYIPKKRIMIAMYPKDRVAAEDVMRRFFSEFEATNSAALGIAVEYIGLTKDPNEPVSGEGQQ
ncbi:hypothetical protein HY358_00525 [Candidatus Roizmanbacteria bacterium]|nr:hypothetical protein [Candidatus Roizmanbacteria bacterium]